MRGTYHMGIMRELGLVSDDYITGVNIDDGVGDQVMENRMCVWRLENRIEMRRGHMILI